MTDLQHFHLYKVKITYCLFPKRIFTATVCTISCLYISCLSISSRFSFQSGDYQDGALCFCSLGPGVQRKHLSILNVCTNLDIGYNCHTHLHSSPSKVFKGFQKDLHYFTADFLFAVPDFHCRTIFDLHGGRAMDVP